MQTWRQPHKYPKSQERYFDKHLTKKAISTEKTELFKEFESGRPRAHAEEYIAKLENQRKDLMAESGIKMKIFKKLRDVERELIERHKEAAKWLDQQLELCRRRAQRRGKLETEHEKVHEDICHKAKVHIHNLENSMPDLSVETRPLDAMRTEAHRRAYELNDIADSMNSMNSSMKKFAGDWKPDKYKEHWDLRMKLDELWKLRDQAVKKHLYETLPRLIAEEEEQRQQRAQRTARDSRDRGRSADSKASGGSARAGSSDPVVRIKSESMSSVERSLSPEPKPIMGSRSGSPMSWSSIKEEPTSLENTPAGGSTWPPRVGSPSEQQQHRSSSRSGRQSGRRGAHSLTENTRSSDLPT